MTRPSLAGIERGDHAWEVKCPTCGAAPGRPCYGNGEMPRHMTHGARAAVRLKALTAAVRDVLALAARLDRLAARHLDSETGRIETAVAHELRTTLAARLDLTDPEGDPT